MCRLWHFGWKLSFPAKHILHPTFENAADPEGTFKAGRVFAALYGDQEQAVPLTLPQAIQYPDDHTPALAKRRGAGSPVAKG